MQNKKSMNFMTSTFGYFELKILFDYSHCFKDQGSRQLAFSHRPDERGTGRIDCPEP